MYDTYSTPIATYSKPKKEAESYNLLLNFKNNLI